MQGNFFVAMALILACGIVSAEDNPVTNGSFEISEIGKCPHGWNFSTSRNAEASAQATDKYSAEGARSILITNKSPFQPHVYGMLYQAVKLEPGKRYRLSCQARSDGSVDLLQFVNGKRWQQRLPLKNLSVKWQLYEFEFVAAPEDFEADGNYYLRLNTEGVTDAVYIDCIAITPAGAQVADAKTFQQHRVYLMPECSIDLKSLKTIPAQLPKLKIPAGEQFFQGGKMPSATDLAAEIALGWAPDGLIFLADVSDDRIVTSPGSEMWSGDSVQLRIDQTGALNEGEKNSDLELGFAPDPDGIKSWCWQLDRPLAVNEAIVTGFTRPGGYVVAVKLFWSFLDKVDFNARKPFSFNVVVNDRDDRQQRRVAFLAPGIHDSKSSSRNTLALFDVKQPSLGVIPAKLKTFKDFSGRIVVSGLTMAQSCSIKAVMVDAQKKQQEFVIDSIAPVGPEKVAIANFKFPLEKNSEGPFTVTFSVPGTAVTSVLEAVKIDLGKEQLRLLDEIDRKLNAARAELPRYYPDGRISRYLELLLTETTRQAAMQRQDLSRKESTEARTFYVERGEITVPEMKQAVNMLEEKLSVLRNGGKLPATWMYVSSPSQLKNGWLMAEAADEQGVRETRGTFFIGYGHFGQVIRDLPLFPKLGGNVIQIEIGPRSFFPKPGKDGDFTEYSLDDFRTRIEPALQRAWENNVKVCLLLSPHYYPGWLLEKYPELKSESGFLKYDVNHPKVREMVGSYLKIIIPLLKNSKYSQALHSLCLSNEPTYPSCRLDSEFTRKQFTAWLEKKYGDIAVFNQASGSNFTNYAAALTAGMTHPAVKYEFYTFKREIFAGWHRWMAESIRSQWPEIPLSAKIMVFNNFKAARIDEGVDPELFSELSDLNGNDNYMNYGQGRWISDWLPMAMGHDLQLSMKKTSICNAENHIIKDGETNPIPYDHIYTAIFQQLTQGVGAMMTWVWVDLDFNANQKQPVDLRGNIFHRPIDIIAQGMAAFDGNRIAPQIISFCQYDPEAAVLYSPTSYILNGEKYGFSAELIYTNLSFSGYKLGFRSEKQLAAGNFGKVKVLFAADAANIRRETLDGLRRFTAQGGKIVTYGDCFKQDEFGRPLQIDFPVTVLPKLNKQALTDKMRTVIADKVKLPVSLTDPAKGNEGLLWRTAITADATIVNLVNYNFEPRRIKITVPEGSRIVDLVSGSELSPEFELKPLHPLLLQIRK